MKFVEVCVKPLAGLAALFLFQPVLAWNNPNLYFFAGALTIFYGLWHELQQSEFELRPSRAFIIGTVLISVGLLGPVLSGLAVTARSQLTGLPVSASAELPGLTDEAPPAIPGRVALRAMRRALDADATLRGRFKVGAPTKQDLDGHLVWAAPLEPTGILAAWFGPPPPAFAVVDASHPDSARLMPTTIAVSDESFFDLDTRVWLHDPTLDVYGWYFELDDMGKPHWIGIVTERKIGFRGYDVTGAISIDVSSAQLRYYPLAKIPDWVTNKYPMELVAAQLNATGDQADGLMHLSGIGRFELASAMNLIYFDGRPCYLGLLSSIGHDDVIKDVVIVDAHTKRMRLIKLDGISDVIAAKALVKATQLRATHPVPYQLAGGAAYIAPLSDEEGNMRGFGAVAVKDATIIAIGDSLPDAVAKFNERARAAR